MSTRKFKPERVYELIHKALPKNEVGERLASVLRPGKSMRTRILFITADPPLSEKDLYMKAAAHEAYHVSTLIHDDIMDHDEMRRGVPTLNARFGSEMAIVYGNMLSAIAQKIISESSFPEREKLIDLSLLAEVAYVVNAGQELQERAEKEEKERTHARWEDIARLKTGSMFYLAVALGRGMKEKVHRERFGRAIGNFLQLRDDMWDFDFDRIAERAFSDLKKNGYNWLLVEAAQTIPHFASVREEARAAGEYRKVSDSLVKEGVYERATVRLEDFHREVLSVMREALCPPEAREEMKEVMDAIRERKAKY